MDLSLLRGIEHMGHDLTLHILPSFNRGADFDRLFKSIKPLLPVHIIQQKDQALWMYRLPLAPDSKWWMYMYDNEWLSKDLAESLTVYFSQSHSDYDAYTLKKEIKYDNRKSRYFDTPRIFANYVTLRYGCLLPDIRHELRPQFILDGMLLGELA